MNEDLKLNDIARILAKAIVSWDSSVDDGPHLLSGVGLMRGIELARRHPEYAIALHQAFERAWPPDRFLDEFVRQFPLALTDRMATE